ncbi:helix-turn-helix domain-containing protein [Actinomadura rubrisoli]|uniref:XRE family transcriptional regulator n=1 Tax=Actinomadura rubrisoli TaxID=2530368 RepID=A0A4R5B5F0_9ACTN|nr:helix-turn-helix transcriptional regulator [Actinomadura rubrisoli]TDD80213.1 XRE family transcriptional regulator [Actinomadura rubrisoli]
MSTAAVEHAGSGFPEAWEAGPTVARMVLGAQLRRLREADGFSREEAGAAVRRPTEWISTLELGRARLKLREVADLCAAYGVTDQAARATLLGLARQANAPGWWSPFQDVIPGWLEPYIGLEQSASIIRAYEAQIVPELLQTGDYTRALLHARHPGAQVERIVQLRTRRQQILYRSRPVRLWAVIDEAALRRAFGSRPVAFAQLEHLIDMCDLGHVTLQVLPLEAEAPAVAGGSFTLLRPPEAELPDVVYVGRLNGAMYPAEPGAVASYWHVMNWLVLEAAPACSTPSILRRILRDL